MKTSLNILAMAGALLLVQACGSKSEKSSEKYVANETPEATAKLTPAEKRAKREKEAAERAERRKNEWSETAKNTPTYTDAEGNVVYNKAEVEPSYPGGEKEMRKYLSDNIQYPQDAQDKGTEATVFVDFVVGTNGKVRDVQVTDIIGEGDETDESFKAEAVRVINSMPAWTAGKQNGKTIYAKYSLPITFQLM